MYWPNTSLCSPQHNTFVIYERQILVQIQHKYLYCDDNTSVVWHMFHTLKNSPPPARNEFSTSCTRKSTKTFDRLRGTNFRPPIHWAITDTPYANTIVILVVTLTIMNIKIFICNNAHMLISIYWNKLSEASLLFIPYKFVLIR